VGRFSAEVLLGSAQEVALGVRLDDRHHYEVVLSDGMVSARQRVGSIIADLGGVMLDTSGPVELVVAFDEPVEEPGRLVYGSDLIRLGVRLSGTVQWLADLDGRYLSTEVAGGFTGRVVGVLASGGSAEVLSFRVERGAAEDLG
jgi:hypothetical protein